MLLFVLAYLGGVLTIFSPCVLPVIPFLFSRSHLSFKKSGLPTLVGMGLSFTLFGVLSAAGGNWVIHVNQYGRYFAMLVFAIVGLTLLFPLFAQRLLQPIVNLGGRLQQRAAGSDSIASSLLVGASVGLLWAPCAGPILGLVLAGAALGGLSQNTFGLLGAFALGAATSLGIAILASGKVMSTIKKGLGAEEWLKKVLGVLVLVSVLAIALGWDTKLLSKFSYLNTNSIEQTLIDFTSNGSSKQTHELKDEGPMPSLDGAITWLNSPALSAESLKGKVVLIDFWTYSCINCLRALPYVQAWSDKYASQGLVVIGVHAPEFAFERLTANVETAVKDLGIKYPVAVDSKLNIWNAFKNQYWPAHYLIDAKGHIQYHHFGEGQYEDTEHMIQKLLKEANPNVVLEDVVASTVVGKGLGQKAGRIKDIANPETYLGYERQENFASAASLLKDAPQEYKTPGPLKLKQWALEGSWIVSPEMVQSQVVGAKISLRFKARDLHLVLANPEGKPVRFRVRLDGKAPAASHGQDIEAAGIGTVNSERLYQLIRQENGQEEHLFEIEFLDPAVEAFAFTFG